MDTKALRQKILDLAIRGKLVPQDPNDEPASVLLERIRAEKQQMVKEGKLKAKDIKNDTIIFRGEDNSYYEKFQDGTVKCIEDEIPFELPEGWAWLRLQSFVDFIGGSQPPKSTFEYSPNEDNIRLIQIRDYKTDKFMTYIPRSKAKRFCNKDDVMIGRYGPPIFQILRGLEGSYNVALMKAIANPDLMLNDYLYYLLQDGELLHMLESLSDRTCGQDGINMYELNCYIVGIPPIHQQKRIINYLREIFPKVEAMTKSKDELSELISFAKSKILDLAIRGKLVPQDPNDEPASILLERIRAEKEELIKQGKIKRDKKESIIFRGDDNSYYHYKDGKNVCIDGELPYELPEGWTWAILPEVVFFQEGPGILKKDFRDNGVPLIRISGLQSDKVLLNGCNYLDPVMVERKWKHFKLELGDVILCTSASIGKASIVGPEAVGAIPYTGQIRFKMTKSLIREYFLHFANSNIYLNQVNQMKTGNCIQHYGPTHLKEVYIPIPPIKEQGRIIEQLSSLLSLLHEIEKNITM